ncbi:NAD(P)-binding protein [Xylaria intraflava]|nr:NAD(P)-binding protein [Xylaria intraflava]
MASWDHRQHMPDLQGRIALVTGGNGGIGYQAVVFLAKAGAKVYFGARSPERAEAACKKMYRENPSVRQGQVNWLQMDMACMESILTACDKLRSRESSLHILINNAAHEGTEPSKMADSGIQVTMQTNHVGVFALTQQLQPLLRAAALKKDSDVRIVMVSSDAPSFSHAEEYRPDFSNPHGGDLLYPSGQEDGFMGCMRRYSVSKMALNLQASELQARYDEERVPILVISVCPGTVWTPGTKRAVPWSLYPIFWLKSYSEIMGPKPVLFAAVSREVREQERYFKGQFINRTHMVIKGHPCTHNAALARELWSSTEQLVHEFKRING